MDSRPLDAASLRRLSGLLDEAMALGVGARQRWLDALTGDALALRPRLEAMLAPGASAASIPAAPSPLDREPARPSVGFHAGQQVGPYRLMRELGSGGMGAVWLAERADGTMARQVALKLPHPLLARGLEQRFAQEREILSTLAHPHIARLYDAGVDGSGLPYLALEYVQGESIDRYARQHALGLRARLELLLQVADAVAHAHARLVVHRDLKPGNILVTAEGRAQLLDFGIATLLNAEPGEPPDLGVGARGATGRAMTLDYASPEQVAGQPIGTASDVYSLGVLAYELLAGHRPYRLARGGAGELREAILGGDIQPASEQATSATLRRALRGDLDAILAQALALDLHRRYSSVESFAADLRRHMAGAPVAARSPTLAYRLGKLALRWRWPLLGGSLAALALLAASGLALWQASLARDLATESDARGRAAQSEARRAQAVQGFLLDIFRANSTAQADPQAAQRTSARELLDIGAARMEVALHDAPEARLEMQATLAQLYAELGLPQRAAALREQRLQLARSLLAPDDPRRAEAALALMNHYYDGAGREQARALLDEARAVVAAAGPRAGPARGILLLQGARFNRFGSLRGWRDDARSAVAFYRADPPKDLTLLRAMQSAGAADLAAGDAVAALQQLSQARDLARARPGDARAALVVPAADLAEAYAALGLGGDALATLDEAYQSALHVHGPAHRVTLMSRILLALEAVRAGRTAEGLRDLRQAQHDIEAQRDLLEGWWRRNAEYQMAKALLERGRPADALPALLDAVEEIRRDLPDSGSRVFRTRLLAEAHLGLGQVDRAAALMDEATSAWDRYAEGVLQPWSSNGLRLSQASLALAQGRADAALALLALIQVAPGLSAAMTDVNLVRRDVLAAQAWLALGAADRSAEAARSALAAAERLQAPLPRLQADAWLVLGRAEQAAGHATAAGRALDRALALRLAHDDPGSLPLAQVRLAIAAGLPGDRADRQDLLRQARQAYRQQAAQPPDWGRPLLGA